MVFLGFTSIRPNAGQAPAPAQAPEAPAAQVGSLNGKTVRIDDSAESRGKAHAVLSECLSDVRRFFQPLCGRVARFFGAIPDWVRTLAGQAKPAAASAQQAPESHLTASFAANFCRLCDTFQASLADKRNMDGAFRVPASHEKLQNVKQQMANGEIAPDSLSHIEIAALIKDTLKQLPLPSDQDLHALHASGADVTRLHREMLSQLPEGPLKQCGSEAMRTLALSHRHADAGTGSAFSKTSIEISAPLWQMTDLQLAKTMPAIGGALLQGWLDEPAAPADPSAGQPSSPADKPVAAEPWRAQYATVMQQLLAQRPQRSE
ncbi:hypothetical protein [Chromobacterium haemolyticum]|uniref:hypothetical protein n=1 Tax=Chromobacterium haemolyticum TaxID=394935 RepID=UPI00307CFCB5